MTPNDGLFSKGADIGGIGFTFDDQQNRVDDVSSLATMRALIEKDPRNQERIFPYLGGEEFNDDPEQRPRRYVINFGEMSEVEARAWPDLMAIVEAKVKPERMKNNRDTYRKYWWQFSEKRSDLFRALQTKSRVLVTSQTSSMRIFAFADARYVFSHKAIVFALDTNPFFAVMQSRAHIDWAAFFGSTMKDDPVYTPSDCFETFPFPLRWESSPSLEDIGRRYHEHRAAVMKATMATKKPEGLTATYNRFHDANERSAGIVTLRALHAEMDRAVLDAYGWTDLTPVYDYRVQLDERVRYTWDEDTRDEVLARLLEENRKRAGENAATPLAHATDEGEGREQRARSAAPTPVGATKRARKRKGDGEPPPTLPGVG